jgi:hypothetical protein
MMHLYSPGLAEELLFLLCCAGLVAVLLLMLLVLAVMAGVRRMRTPKPEPLLTTRQKALARQRWSRDWDNIYRLYKED